MKKPSAVNRTVETNQERLLARRGEGQEAWLCLIKRREHRADAALVVERQIEAEEDRHEDDEHVLDDSGPGGAANARDDDVERNDCGAENDRDAFRNRAVARDLHDDAEPGELQDEIGDERHDAHKGHENPESRAREFRGEEVRLGDELQSARIGPDRRQHEIGDHIGERAIGENVESRRAEAIGVAGGAEEREGRVDLAREQQEHQDGAEAATTDGPFLQLHLMPAARGHAEYEGPNGRERDENECDVHRASPSGSAAWRTGSSQ